MRIVTIAALLLSSFSGLQWDGLSSKGLVFAQTGPTWSRPWTLCLFCFYDAKKDECARLVQDTCDNPGDIAAEDCDEMTRGLEILGNGMALRSSFLVETCIHPYLLNATEVAEITEVIGLESAVPVIIEEKLVGSAVAYADINTLVQMGMKGGTAIEFYNSFRRFLAPKLPLNFRIPIDEPQSIQATISIESISHVDPEDFNFDTLFQVTLVWRDEKIWADCSAKDDDVWENTCQFMWRPEIVFHNAIDYKLVDHELTIISEVKHGVYQLRYSGRFHAPMTFRNFPRDTQELPVALKLKQLEGSMFQAHPVSSLINLISERTFHTEKNIDFLSGFEINRVHTISYTNLHVDWKILNPNEGALRDLLEELGTEEQNSTLQSTDIIFQATVVVDRLSLFYMLNYVLVVIILTSVSWGVFLIPPWKVNERSMLSITIVLALNVYQLIIDDRIPVTGYLTPMHWFIIGSSAFVCFAASESIIAQKLHTRWSRRKALLTRTKSNNALSSFGSCEFEKVIVTPTENGDKLLDEDQNNSGRRLSTVEMHPPKELKKWEGFQRQLIVFENLIATRIDTVSLIVIPISYVLFAMFMLLIE